jgi:hypothetical protein
MFIHPQIHLEISRQRHQDLLVEADRRRLAKASRRAGVCLASAAEQREHLATQRDSDGVFTGGAADEGRCYSFRTP